MKRKLLTFLICFGTLLMINSCSTTRVEDVVDADYTDNNNNDQVRNAGYIINLADLLRRKHNIEIVGSGRNAQAIIRGIQSINDTSLPVYYVNNVRVGRDLSQVSNTVSANEVKRIKVIGGLSELAIYGHDGRNGVIKIYTQKS